MVQLLLGACREVELPVQVLTQQAVGVLSRAALPRTLRIAEVDVDSGVGSETDLLGHLLAPVPGLRPGQLLEQRGTFVAIASRTVAAFRFSGSATSWTNRELRSTNTPTRLRPDRPSSRSPCQ